MLEQMDDDEKLDGKLPLEGFLCLINEVWGHLFMERVVKDNNYLN